MTSTRQVVDPAVSRRKFEREIAQYRAQEATYRKRGWWLMRAEFPEVLVAFISVKTKPPAVGFGALLDFTNYDLWPPSVRLVDPFTETAYQFKNMPLRLAQRAQPDRQPHALAQVGNQMVGVNFLDQAWGQEAHPFICLPGVREYHSNPGHSGDPWLLHRRGGEGTLYFILEKLWRYGTDAVDGLSVNLVPQIAFPSNLPL